MSHDINKNINGRSLLRQPAENGLIVQSSSNGGTKMPDKDLKKLPCFLFKVETRDRDRREDTSECTVFLETFKTGDNCSLHFYGRPLRPPFDHEVRGSSDEINLLHKCKVRLDTTASNMVRPSPDPCMVRALYTRLPFKHAFTFFGYFPYNLSLPDKRIFKDWRRTGIQLPK
ncbi:hypothetical protein H5410_010901 [Solanum commersonii]|uniref:Uncharacterized protein n=1 Tax=Solanum commersonii TaxID=4109 RepID=A0A9J6AN41_SOLCO|nr:hypothetical protein H5410_010901 [Solanum commersonii]